MCGLYAGSIYIKYKCLLKQQIVVRIVKSILVLHGEKMRKTHKSVKSSFELL